MPGAAPKPFVWCKSYNWAWCGSLTISDASLSNLHVVATWPLVSWWHDPYDAKSQWECEHITAHLMHILLMYSIIHYTWCRCVCNIQDCSFHKSCLPQYIRSTVSQCRMCPSACSQLKHAPNWRVHWICPWGCQPSELTSKTLLTSSLRHYVQKGLFIHLMFDG